jgi:Ca2+-binding RTX toxin-like protein
VVETVAGAAGGIDLVRSTVGFELTFNVEKLTLLGSDNIDGLGNNLNNTLIGNAGANVLDGSTGNDTMTGGKGDDTYIVDALGDAVIEAAGGGTDLVQSSVTFSLASRINVENLELTGVGKITGTGNALANIITGNDGDNTLNGAAGNDTLTGGDGIDRLTGGTGRDVFDYNLLTDVGDTITDFTKGANGDVLALHDILADAGFAGSDAFADGFLSFDSSGKNTVITVFDGGIGPGTVVATLLNVSLTQIDTANFLT